MANDIFNRKIAGAHAFSADQAVLSFAGINGLSNATLPLLVQNMQLSYQQPVSMMFDMASEDINFVRGRAAGNGAIGMIYGPAAIQTAFLQKYGDVCQIAGNTMSFTIKSSSCGDQERVSNGLKCTYSAITTVGFSGTAQDMMINQSVGFMFGFLEIS